MARAGDSVPRDAPPPERIVQEALTVSRKSKTNFPLNAAMFLLMSCMVSSGLLMKYVLLPGSQRQEKFGRNVDLFLFGMDRHDWGTVHLVMGLLLIALLAVHIVLHWKEITGVFSKWVGSPGQRTMMAWIFVLACALLIALPFILNPTAVERGQGAGQGARRGQVERAR